MPQLGPVFTASYPGDCEYGDEIEWGDEIRADGEGGWVHAECARMHDPDLVDEDDDWDPF